jgi:hypothetical protein
VGTLPQRAIWRAAGSELGITDPVGLATVLNDPMCAFGAQDAVPALEQVALPSGWTQTSMRRGPQVGGRGGMHAGTVAQGTGGSEVGQLACRSAPTDRSSPSRSQSGGSTEGPVQVPGWLGIKTCERVWQGVGGRDIADFVVEVVVGWWRRRSSLSMRSRSRLERDAGAIGAPSLAEGGGVLASLAGAWNGTATTG